MNEDDDESTLLLKHMVRVIRCPKQGVTSGFKLVRSYHQHFKNIFYSIEYFTLRVLLINKIVKFSLQLMGLSILQFCNEFVH